MRRPKRTTWFVIADGGRFKVFDSEGPKQDLKLIKDAESDESRRPSRNIGTDKPGRGRNIGTGAPFALQPGQDFHNAAKREFLKSSMEFVNHGAREGRFQQLVVVAPAKALAAIRSATSQDALDKTIASLSLDLSKIPESELRDRLVEKLHHW
ncbi:MAG: host attachment protein [Parvularculaceae bacterium]